MKWKVRLFPYENMDYKAAEAWLNRQAAKGWALERVWLSTIALFSSTDREDLRYCIDLHGKWEPTQEDGYFQLCSQAGWDYVAQVRSMSVFASRAVANPVPLQTDRNMEDKLYWRRAIRPAIFGSLLWLLVLLAIAAAVGLMGFRYREYLAALTPLLCSTSFLCWILGTVFCFLGLLWAIPAGILHWRRWKKAVEEDAPVPASHPVSARLLGHVQRLGGLMVRLYLLFCVVESFASLVVGYSGFDIAERRPEYREHPLVMAEDVGLDDTKVGYLSDDPVFSPLVQGEKYMEEVETENGVDVVWCERYTCLTEWYAKVVTHGLLGDTARINYRGCGIMNFRPARLGTDGGWSAREGSFLLLREGRTVALVGVQCLGGDSPDLTEPEQLQTILERLEMS